MKAIRRKRAIQIEFGNGCCRNDALGHGMLRRRIHDPASGDEFDGDVFDGRDYRAANLIGVVELHRRVFRR